MATDELAEYYKAVGELIEETYRINDEEPVVIICHSLGCPVILYYLNRLSQEWKDIYIRSMVALAGID